MKNRIEEYLDREEECLHLTGRHTKTKTIITAEYIIIETDTFEEMEET